MNRLRDFLVRAKTIMLPRETSAAGNTAVVRRWSKEELARRLQVLESSDPRSWTAQDHYDVLEYLVQRYYPRDEPLLQVDWDRSMARMRAQVDANLRDAARGIKAPADYLEVNRLIQVRRELLASSYAMSLEDFARLVVPALRHYPFAVDLVLSESDTRTLWEASASVSPTAPHAQRHAASDARDELVGLLHPAVLDSAVSLRRTYEVLRRAQNALCVSASVIAPAKCRCLHDLLDGRMVGVARLLGAFEDGAPLIPPARTPCTVCESPSVCQVTLLPIEPPLMRPGDDPDFAARLQEILSGHRPALDEDWQERLEARVRASAPGKPT